MALADLMPASWRSILADEFAKPYFLRLQDFVDQEIQRETVFPPKEQIFSAFELTPYAEVKVLLLGQDPYHGPGQANGLCFSVAPGVTKPPSLVNIYKELQDDLGIPPARSGDLSAWARSGVLMLNAVLTVQAHKPASHKDQGWETFTDAVIRKLNEKDDHVVFVLWGGYAKKKAKLIDPKRHTILEGIHPSPLSAKNGFFGSKPFSQVNAALAAHGQAPLSWSLDLR